MVNLTTNITITLAIPNIRKWRVSNFLDRFDEDVPYARITIEALGTNRIYKRYQLYTFNVVASTGLRIKATPLTDRDQLETYELVIPNAYTQCSDAYNNAAGNTAAKLRALEPLLLTLGLLTSDFAGS